MGLLHEAEVSPVVRLGPSYCRILLMKMSLSGPAPSIACLAFRRRGSQGKVVARFRTPVPLPTPLVEAPSAVSGGSLMVTFEAFILEVVKRRPTDDDWKRQICYALLGLAGESATLLHVSREWAPPARAPRRTALLTVLGPFEVYRALAYYQLDCRPSSTYSPRIPVSLEASAQEVAMQTGRLATHVREWMFERMWLDRRLNETFVAFESARRRYYQLLDVQQEDVWHLYAAGAWREESGREMMSTAAGVVT